MYIRPLSHEERIALPHIPIRENLLALRMELTKGLNPILVPFGLNTAYEIFVLVHTSV